MPIFFSIFSILFGALSAQAESLCIANVNVVDVRAGRITSPVNVRVQEDRITAVDRSACPVSGFRIIDGRGKFLAPGLIDMHVHTDLWHYGVQADDHASAMYVLNGVTTYRDAAGSPLTLKIKKEILEKRRFGPSMEVASLFITSNPKAGGNEVFLSNPLDARIKIANFAAQGYSSVKVGTDLLPEVYTASARAARANGLYLFGHPLTAAREDKTFFVRFDESLRSLRTLEHLNWTFGDALQDKDSPYLHTKSLGELLWLAFTRLDAAKIPEVVAKLKAARVFVSPTLLVVYLDSLFKDLKLKFELMGEEGFARDPILKYLPPYIYSDWKSIYESWDEIFTPLRLEQMRISLRNAKTLLTALDRAGIPLLVGTDAPARPYAVHGFAFHDELNLMVKSGVSIPSALRAATLNAAYAIGKPGRLGEVRVGAQADLLLLDRNPFQNILNLKSYQSMILRGEYLDQNRLKQEWADLYRRSHSVATKRLSTNLKISAQTLLHERDELK